METISLELTSNLRRETLHGRRYIVADASMIVPGVLNGSQGALYYPIDEVKKNPGIWNGVPVTVGHPYDLTGNNISARDPKIEKQFRIGTVYNDRFENGKRKAEVWLDEELTKNKSPEIYKSASAGVPIELSTGLFTDNEQVENGKAPDGRAYDYVARNYRPDHLAILPNQTGACSLKDGCGLNVNELQVDNCGGEGGTPGPCPSSEPGKSKPISAKAHKDLGYHGFKTTDGKTYTHESMPGHKIEVTGHEDAGGGRQRLTWSHTAPNNDTIKGSGVSQLDYHAMRELQRASKTTTNTEVTSVTNQKRTLLSQLASLLGFKVNPVSNTKKVCNDDAEPDADEDDMTENGKDHEEPDADDMGGPSDGDEDNNKKKKSTNNSSNGDEPMTRPQLVSWLTANCDCHKGKDKVLANKDNYSDEELLKLKTNAETAMKNATLVANAKLAGNAEVPVEEEEEEDEEEDMPFKGKKKAPMVNSLAQFEASMPPAAKAIWNSAKEVEQSERLRLTSIITANISDVARKQVLTNKLMDREKTTLDDLRDLASAIPQRQVRNQQAVIPNFFGNQPGTQFQAQTNNSGQDDLLELPTINYADLAKSGDVRDRA